ncbi:uncharacterized protein I303_107953 [Kwoniella dejecticola CBS 10117]|uniref:NADH dehydrogenase (Ubiquinone) complex I, assembly factor 6 n=1 Tax=Kwoniella dejecticola CBS 10117 TaxID=1296121 RepID=A0A1A5ZW49_9TREE|nr:uncharacterized protein I303_07946 [Kwoniella dejecticola CBS 10117]OBR82032.1 hypothetical protein I303_07946 [Kwoniella dejecticola CBS 10117]
MKQSISTLRRSINSYLGRSSILPLANSRPNAIFSIGTGLRPSCITQHRYRRSYASSSSSSFSSSSSSNRSHASVTQRQDLGRGAGGPQAPLEYCSALVKRLDPEAWLCSYFWPKRERGWFLAYRAFNLELHLITQTISQPALAAIRFQFWRDTLQTIFSPNDKGSEPSQIPQHPVAVLLADMKRNRPVQRYYLSNLIETRAKALSLPPSSSTLTSHLSTHSPIGSSLLLGPLPILLPPAHPETAHISHTLSHLSTLLTTVSLLRNLPLLVSGKKQINIPHDISQKHSLVEEEIFRKGAEATGLRDAILEIGTRGMDELITARRDLKETQGRVKPESAMPIFLSAVPAENYLKRLESLDFDVFSPELLKHDWKLAPKIWWAFQTGKL